jgi:hypothetical protein
MFFQNVNEIKAILPIGVGNDFNRLKPHIENAENKYIRPLLGLDICNEMQQHYEIEPPEVLTDEWIVRLELIKKIQFATIHLAFFLGFDFLNISVTDAGFQRIETERTKGLYKYQEDSLKTFFSTTGFNALDDILVYLENNIQLFENFLNSVNYTKLVTSFLPTVKVIEEIPFNIHGSRLIFLALQPAIAYFEDTTIKSILGEAIYKTVKTEMANDVVDVKVRVLLTYIRKPLIYLATAMLMEETGATLYDKGLYFDKNEDQQRAKVVKGPASDVRVAIVVARNQRIANDYLEMLKAHLLSNWEEYSGQTGSIFKRDNNGKKTFWT